MEKRKKPSLEQFRRETVLDSEQCAEWLGLSVDTIEREDIPCAYLGARGRRYVVGDVIDFLRLKMKRAS